MIRLLQWSPIGAPAAAALVLWLWPQAWQPLFGKETASEHVTHALLLAASLVFFVAWRRHRLPGLALLAAGTLLVLIEEVDYGYVYLLDGHVDEALHNTTVGVWGLLAAEACFVALPFALPPDSPLRRWAPISRPAAAAVGAMALMLVLAQASAAEVGGYPVREGADEVHDLGVALALFALALRSVVARRSPRPTGQRG